MSEWVPGVAVGSRLSFQDGGLDKKDCSYQTGFGLNSAALTLFNFVPLWYRPALQKIGCIMFDRSLNLEKLKVDEFWSSREPELRVHRIHSYPAKFPATLAAKAITVARGELGEIQRVADIFCGCGTTAVEARRSNLEFWGCDINPVATLIARTKRQRFVTKTLNSRAEEIFREYEHSPKPNVFPSAPERLKYWYSAKQYNQLFALLRVIEEVVPPGKYLDFFHCCFSGILKATSRWLTKSIKPQVDPKKVVGDVASLFRKNCEGVIDAFSEPLPATKSVIITSNFLSSNLTPPPCDLIVTSPPYVTSYEYADLHQLTSLWLEFVQDYRDLRAGTIGSSHSGRALESTLPLLNETAFDIVTRLISKDRRRARSVASYYLDMQRTIHKASSALAENGQMCFVVGDTAYLNVKIENTRHLHECLSTLDFETKIRKRKVQQKNLTPFRDSKGQFSSDSTGRKVYAEEFVIWANR